MALTPTGAPGVVRRAYLLAGRATRLPGKFLLPFGGEPVVLREVRLLRSLGLEVTLVGVAPVDLPDVRFLRDRLDRGPLGGLASALADSNRPFFLFGADMPFLDRAGIEALRARFRGRTLVPVSRSGHWQVLHAIYTGREGARLPALLEAGRGLHELIEVLLEEDTAELLPAGLVAERSFTDLDTPADYARALAAAGYEPERTAGVGRTTGS